MRIKSPILILVLSLLTVTCQSNPAGGKQSVPVESYEVVKVFLHDPSAFTQGLIFHDGTILESTGQVGHSSLRRVELETGNVLQRVNIPPPYFAEGITLLKGKIYQLTWEQQRGFIYDALTFDLLGEFNYHGEGWGLTNDGQSLILSDGTSRIRFIDPVNFQVQKTIAVSEGTTPLSRINELEYVRGEIYANIWYSDKIARINPQTGAVTGWIDLTGIRSEPHDSEEVLNGIAFDETSGRLFVTGKLWPKLFEIRLIQKQRD